MQFGTTITWRVSGEERVQVCTFWDTEDFGGSSQASHHLAAEQVRHKVDFHYMESARRE